MIVKLKTRRRSNSPEFANRSAASKLLHRTGAAAVEFALVAPLFFMVLFGILEIGRALMAQNALINASREAARFAVLDGATASEVVATAESASNLGFITNPQVVLEPAGLAANGNNLVTVTVSVPFDQISWLPMPGYLSGKTLSASTTMRRESYDISNDTTSTSGSSGSSGSTGGSTGNGKGK